jgi:dTDP-4-dehydrorhamnose 3,5-epimerase
MARLIAGVTVRPLKAVPDERGRIMEILRSDDREFRKFGELALTTVYPGAIKGWHRHRVQWDHFAVARGMLKLVLVDTREDSETHDEINEFFLGDHNPLIVTIPPQVLHGFKGIDVGETIVVSCASEPFDHADPDEERLDPHLTDIPYDWDRRDS